MKQLSAKHIVSLVSASAVVLSLAHHWLNFWGLPWQNQILFTVVAVPLVAFLILKFSQRIWDQLAGISKKRWAFFLIPAIVLAAIVSWRIFTPPVVWHTLEIFPPHGNQKSEVRLLEIKDSQGRKVQPSQVRDLGNWIIRGGIFVPAGTGGEPLVHTFFGRIDMPVLLTFATAPPGAEVSIVLDGKSTVVDLGGQIDGQRAAEIAVGYRFGLNNRVVIALIYLLDLLALMFLSALLWVIQEIAQTPRDSLQTSEWITAAHRRNLAILVALGLAIHIVNYFSVPLIVVGDSTAYLSGAVHWLNYHNLDGVPAARGPGMAMLFIPILSTFGPNPWAAKLFLHLMALACVPLGYLLGWQISGQRWFALAAGITVILTPDLYLYSNLVMSDIPNILLGLLFMILLIQAVKAFNLKWLIAAALIGSFNVLVRPENLLAFAIGMLFLAAKGLSELKTDKSKDFRLSANKLLWRMGAATLVGFLPLLWWSSHNYRVHGFFDLSNHAGDALHDGWIYYGEASRLSITNPESQSVQQITSAFSLNDPRPPDDRDTPTAHWTTLALIGAGYTEVEAQAILVQASIDSILNDPARSIELFFLKFRDGFAAESLGTFTFPFPQEETRLLALKAIYFDEETANIPWLINLQRAVYQLMGLWYEKGPADVWIRICLVMLTLNLYRRPYFLWLLLMGITSIRIFLPTVLSLPHWRYVLAGILPLQILALYTLSSLVLGASMLFQRGETSRARATLAD